VTLTAAAALVATFASPISPLVRISPAAAAVSPGGGGEFTPLAPFRVVDTRRAGDTTIKNGLVTSRPVAGVAGSGIPATGVLAVAMNVTVVNPTAAGFLTVWPTGQAVPNASSHNFRAGEISPNFVVTGVGTNGQVSFKMTGGGAAHLLVDTVGYYGTSGTATRGGRLIPVPPKRLLDTRARIGVTTTSPLGPNSSLFFNVRGVAPVPANATAVVLNVTATQPTASTFLTAYPDGGVPFASNLNLVAGETRPNLVMMKLGADGSVRIYNAAGSVHVIADVVGYYQNHIDDTFTGRVVPLAAPFRAFDTREYATRLGPNQQEGWNFQPFVASLSSGGAAVGPITGLIANFTSTAVTANSYVTFWPDDAGRPVASALNTAVGQDIPNLQVVALSKGAKPSYLDAYNFTGYLHYLADVTAVILSD